MDVETLEVNGIMRPVKIHYEKRKDCRVSIRKKAINIRILSFLSEKEKRRQLTSLKQWAIDRLKENPERFKPEAQKEYRDGDVFTVGNDEYVLKIEFKDKRGSSARMDGSTIQLSISTNLSNVMQNDHISTLLCRCIAKKRIPELKERIDELNKKHFDQPLNEQPHHEWCGIPLIPGRCTEPLICSSAGNEVSEDKGAIRSLASSEMQWHSSSA